MRPLMTVTYTKVRGAPAIHRWPRHRLVATTLHWTTGLPHDLGHWLMEAQVDLPWGFWSLAGQRAPFDSFRLVEGRWPRDGADVLARARRKHREGMQYAETHGGTWLADPDLDVRADWPDIRRRMRRAYAFEDHPFADVTIDDVERLRPFAIRNAAIWDALPLGGSVEVTWPGPNDLVIVPTETRGLGSLPPEHQPPAWATRPVGTKRRHHKHQRTFDLVPTGASR